MSPSTTPTSKGLISEHPLAPGRYTTLQDPVDIAFWYEPFPVRSPLLRESFSVSIPPLTNMLKFSGWPSARSGLTINALLKRKGLVDAATPPSECTLRQRVRRVMHQAGLLTRHLKMEQAPEHSRLSSASDTMNYFDAELDDPQENLRGRMRSDFYRLTEFRTSLCVSQFAASFIGTRAKASTAAVFCFTRWHPVHGRYSHRSTQQR